jgi:hypothetical protein
MDDFLLLDGTDFLLLDGSGDLLILGTTPVPPPGPSGAGIGGGGRGARGRADPFRRRSDKFIRQSNPQQIVLFDDDEILAVIRKFLEKL